MRFAALCMLAVFLVLSGSGCSWVGQTTGKLQRKIEQNVDNLETGYEQGYSEGNRKTPAAETPAKSSDQRAPESGTTTPLEQ